ncbi:MAG: DUF6390 family protein [Mycobacterium sp.]
MRPTLFSCYAFPPNELGYCGPPDASLLLHAETHSQVHRHAREFSGAWPYLEEIAAAAQLRPLDPEVVRSYWVGGPLLDRVDGGRLLSRVRQEMARQPTGCLDLLDGGEEVLAHHSFHVMVVYPWVRFLDSGPETPLRVLQSCRIRWGVTTSVDDELAVINSTPLLFDGRRLYLGPARPETVRWNRAGTTLVPRPEVGQTVSAHWDWVCGTLDAPQLESLATATETTIALVNRVRARR